MNLFLARCIHGWEDGGERGRVETEFKLGLDLDGIFVGLAYLDLKLCAVGQIKALVLISDWSVIMCV